MIEQSSTIDLLLSTEQIRNMIAQYGVGADQRNNATIMKPLFSSDAVWLCDGFGEFHGDENIAQALSAIAEQTIVWSFHAMATPWIQIHPDRETAEAHWPLWELARVIDPTRHTTEEKMMAGFYRASLIRKHGRWLFNRVELDLQVSCDYTPIPMKKEYE